MEDRELARALEALKRRLDDDVLRSGALDRIVAGVEAGIGNAEVGVGLASARPSVSGTRMHRPARARIAAALLAACLAGIAVGVVLPPPDDTADTAVASLDNLTFGPLEGFEP